MIAITVEELKVVISAETKQLKQAIKEAQQQLHQLEKSADTTDMKKGLAQVQNTLGQVSKQSNKTTKDMNALSGAMRKTASSAKEASDSFGKDLLKRLVTFELLKESIKKVIGSANETISTLREYDKALGDTLGYNKEIIEMRQNWKTLTADMGVGLANLYVQVAPVMNAIMSGLSETILFFNKLTAALSGKTTYTIANPEYWGKIANGVDATSNSATKLYRTIAKFDELNLLNSNTDTTSSSGLNILDAYKEEELTGGWLTISENYEKIRTALEVLAGLLAALKIADLISNLGKAKTASDLLSDAFDNKNQKLGKQNELEAAAASGVGVLANAFSNATSVIGIFAGALALGAIIADLLKNLNTTKEAIEEVEETVKTTGDEIENDVEVVKTNVQEQINATQEFLDNNAFELPEIKSSKLFQSLNDIGTTISNWVSTVKGVLESLGNDVSISTSAVDIPTIDFASKSNFYTTDAGSNTGGGGSYTYQYGDTGTSTTTTTEKAKTKDNLPALGKTKDALTALGVGIGIAAGGIGSNFVGSKDSGTLSDEVIDKYIMPYFNALDGADSVTFEDIGGANLAYVNDSKLGIVLPKTYSEDIDYEYLESLFGRGGSNVNIDTTFLEEMKEKIASGGFANGGIVSSDLFWANENGSSELIGKFGNKTAVMNQEQIVSSVSSGVASAIVSAFDEEDFVSILVNQVSRIVSAIDEKDMNVSLSDDSLGKAVQRANVAYKRRTGASMFD